MKSFILLDRSGSMATHWVETIGALNAYAEKLAESEPKAKITIASFDSQSFDVVRDGVKAKDWSTIYPDEITPRSMTPLLDAIGKLGGLVKGKRVSICILTDGKENASREMTRDSARGLIEQWKSSGYDVVFIGADFDAFDEAGSLGIARAQTMNTSKDNIGATMTAMAMRATNYAKTGDNKVAWSDEDREAAK